MGRGQLCPGDIALSYCPLLTIPGHARGSLEAKERGRIILEWDFILRLMDGQNGHSQLSLLVLVPLTVTLSHWLFASWELMLLTKLL